MDHSYFTSIYAGAPHHPMLAWHQKDWVALTRQINCADGVFTGAAAQVGQILTTGATNALVLTYFMMPEIVPVTLLAVLPGMRDRVPEFRHAMLSYLCTIIECNERSVCVGEWHLNPRTFFQRNGSSALSTAQT